jgi:DNA-binding response OmpR family regulator
LVEDDPATSGALRVILGRKGWQVVVVSTVAEALALLDGPSFRWLVLDLMLPDGDGTALLRKIRDERLDTRVAVTTGSSDAARLRAVTELRPELFLVKPIDLPALLQGLDE